MEISIQRQYSAVCLALVVFGRAVSGLCNDLSNDLACCVGSLLAVSLCHLNYLGSRLLGNGVVGIKVNFGSRYTEII